MLVNLMVANRKPTGYEMTEQPNEEELFIRAIQDFFHSDLLEVLRVQNTACDE